MSFEWRVTNLSVFFWSSQIWLHVTLQALAISIHSLYRAGKFGGRRWLSWTSGLINEIHLTTPSTIISVVKCSKHVISPSISLELERLTFIHQMTTFNWIYHPILRRVSIIIPSDSSILRRAKTYNMIWCKDVGGPHKDLCLSVILKTNGNAAKQ